MKRVLWLVILLTLLALGAIGWFLTSESSFLLLREESYQSPTVVDLTGTVEILTLETNDWVLASVGTTLSAGQRIRTQQNGQVLLRFSNEADLFLGEATEIAFTLPMYLWNGDISYHRFTGSPSVPNAIRTADGVLRLGTRLPDDRDEFHVRRGLRGTRVAVDRGSATWVGHDLTTPLNQGQYLSFSSIDVLEQSPVIRNPESGEHFSRGYLFQGFNIVWDEVAGADSYQLEIRRIDEGLAHMRWTLVDDRALRLRHLPEGQYAIRVHARYPDGSRGAWSNPVSFAIGGRFFDTLRKPTSGQEPVVFDVAEYRDNLLLGGWMREDLARTHEIVFYALTDEWWLQPRSDDFRIQADPDGYFEVYSRSARSVYLMLVTKGEGQFPERAARSRHFPFPDGRHILYHIEKSLR